MTQKLQMRRVLLMMSFLALAFAGLGYRLVDLQVFRHEELATLAQENTSREYVEAPRRGDILDSRGNLLATSVMVKTVCADPVVIGSHQAEVSRLLAPFLGMSESDIFQRLTPRTHPGEKGVPLVSHYVRLKQRVPDETFAQIQAAMSQLALADEARLSKADRMALRELRQHGVFGESDQLRVYPNNDLAAHVLGFAGADGLTINGNHVSQISGRDGIELMMNSALSGVAGWRQTETDRQQHELVALRGEDVESRDGLNVVLTLDAVVQHILETGMAEAMQKHTPLSITGIIMRPRTGEILAMATLPDFNPNYPGASPADSRLDRVISDIMEPGSTFKIVVVSGALNDHVVQLNDAFDCEQGHFAFAGRILHDHEPFGVLTTESIITKSSNIGAAKIGIRLGQDRLYDYAHAYGFGERTGIPLPGEVSGILHPVKSWSKVSIAQIPMGHGVAVTRLQMILAMSAIANGGWLMRPMLVDRLEDEDGKMVARYEPQRVRQVVSESASRQMIEALKTVVSKDGTAPGAAMDHYTVAGKTGTAQKAGAGGYLPDKYVASFIGFFPADKPELCISIVMDEPREGYYGGQVCGPVFKEIAERTASYLNIPPDDGYQPQSGPQPMAASGSTRSLQTASARLAANP